LRKQEAASSLDPPAPQTTSTVLRRSEFSANLHGIESKSPKARSGPGLPAGNYSFFLPFRGRTMPVTFGAATGLATSYLPPHTVLPRRQPSPIAPSVANTAPSLFRLQCGTQRSQEANAGRSHPRAKYARRNVTLPACRQAGRHLGDGEERGGAAARRVVLGTMILGHSLVPVAPFCYLPRVECAGCLGS